MTGRSGAATVEVVPVTAQLRERVLLLAPHPAQEVFSGRAAQTLPVAEADPRRHPYAMVEAGRPVGFFVVDETPPEADPAADLHLRAFFVDAAAQGRGVAKAAVHGLEDLLQTDFPAARLVVLTVNARNPAARAAYLAGGFADTGELYLGGPAGPQHVLRLEVGNHRASQAS